jgi:carotenoid cleavage dioxygenase-like enzyme
VLLEQPLYISLPSMMLGTPASHIFMNWAPEDGTRVHVVPLDGSGVRAWLDACASGGTHASGWLPLPMCLSW